MICLMLGLREEGWRFEHTHLKMSSIQHRIHRKDGVFTHTNPPLPPPPPPVSPFSVTTMHNQSSPSSSGTRISPAVLFIIVIIAVLFFISGLLHLLIRFLTKHNSSSGNSESNDRYPQTSTSDALQRQLQQLFHLHDSGLDQAFIDALPVFMYKEIVGLKEPFDCAVCLCEFSDKDKLRLLPTCSHAFHINCIDTWLLSNSTCPLCRDTLFNPDFSIENPIFDFDDSREDDEHGLPSGQSQKSIEIEQVPAEKKGVFPVRLGKFRKLNVGEGGEAGGETSSRNLDARRCYSMGSYEYVVVDSSLEVALSHERGLKLEKEHGNPSMDEDMEGKKISIGTKTDSYSVSKIWLWSKKGKYASSSGIPMHNPSSFNTDLPWLDRTQGSELVREFPRIPVGVLGLPNELDAK